MEIAEINKGSFNWYLYRSGEFVTTMAKAIQRADKDNLVRIEQAFPQMVTAFKQLSWNITPEDFEPVYNAYQNCRGM